VISAFGKQKVFLGLSVSEGKEKHSGEEIAW